MASYLNKRARPVVGGGDRPAGRPRQRRRRRPAGRKLTALKDDELPDNMRVLKAPRSGVDETESADEPA